MTEATITLKQRDVSQLDVRRYAVADVPDMNIERSYRKWATTIRPEVVNIKFDFGQLVFLTVGGFIIKKNDGEPGVKWDQISFYRTGDDPTGVADAPDWVKPLARFDYEPPSAEGQS